MPLLYFWRGDNYYRDLDMGAGYNLNQRNPLLHSIDIGDSLWAFTRNRDRQYVLAAELVAKAKTHNAPDFRYGRYRLWGDIDRSRYFQVDGQPSIEQVIRQLSCRTEANILGRSFQGTAAVKQITQTDHEILLAFARDLPLEPRARILPEERLEAALLLDNPSAVEDLVFEERPGMAKTRREYLYRQAPARNRALVRELNDLYEGKCQVCGWNPRDEYGVNACQGHHIHWISRGGEDELSNMVLVCPNHHVTIHRCDAPFDFSDKCFDFDIRCEPLLLNNHL